ncbi:MAG TPA: hypothetical protein VNN13_10780, partial [Methylomirabilota bacterium]|nr:hypothetical protein [Methylomirabilota bacterium]
MKRSITAGIVLFWCLMNFFLVKRYLGAPPQAITLNGTEKLTESMEEWWGVYFRGEKIGYAAQIIAPKPKGYRLRDFSVMNLNLLGAVQPTTTRLEMEANEEWILQRFEFELQSKEVRFSARGSVDQNKLNLEVDSAGHRSSREIML